MHGFFRWMAPVACTWLMALGLNAPAATTSVVLVASNSVWSYFKGTQEASSPDRSAWTQPSFGDNSWTKGAAPFGYGETAIRFGTPLPDMLNSYTTLFLRRSFVITNVAEVGALTLSAVCDDGFIAWLNGTRVVTYAAPVGDPFFNSGATVNAAEPVGFQAFPVADSETLVVPGTNLLAVQVFNISAGSSDVVFDAALTMTTQAVTQPVIVSVSPEPGPVTNLTEITVQFSKPVRGVDAADFFVDELPASSVSGSGATYTFAFPQPDYGRVGAFWSMNNGITDLGNPPNAFNPTGPGSTWLYELIDPNAPTVAAVHPPPGLAVRQLTQVEVTFDKPVQGVDAGDLLVNSQPATEIVEVTAASYVFRFPAVLASTADLAWANDHGITDLAPEPHPFAGAPWQYPLDPGLSAGRLSVNEFMAENVSGLKDEDAEQEDWIEIYNPGETTVNLEGWALTDELGEPGKWVFPSVTLGAQKYLVVFASGKDRKPTTAGSRLHTNFKLSLAGEYLALLNAESPRQVVSELAPQYPEQRNDYSYGQDPAGQWRYYKAATPGAANGEATVTQVVAPAHFSVSRGFFQTPFNLSLSSVTPGATIRFTFDGSVPTETNGTVYGDPIPIAQTRIVRAAAFLSNALPSQVRTYTYLYGISASRRLLPALSLVTGSNNLYGRNGIMEYNPRNTTKHGIAWERPVSAELIRPEDNGGFQADCGIRVQGGGYIRGLYNYRSTSIPESKYSFRLYFRGDYGPGRLDYRMFADTTVESFDTLSLRAGMNDAVNPYIRDSLVRALASDTGQVASHGTFVNLFLNGVYKGYYNPSERIDLDFLQTYQGGGKDWDMMAAMSELREGDRVAWSALLNYVNANAPTNPVVYQEIGRRLDLVNFVDYLLPLIYADTDDWPHNNWRAARERVAGAPFRFYVWDAEWSFGYNNSVSHNTIANQLSSTSPPWGGAEIQRLFLRLKTSPEFRLLFADRIHKHFFNDGVLTDARIKARYEQMKAQVSGTIAGFNNTIGTTWIPQRRRYLTNHFASAGLLASSNAPGLSPFGGRVAHGFPLVLATSEPGAAIYYTTNGGEPRTAFTSVPASAALRYNEPVPLDHSVILKARTLGAAGWSALTEAAFQVDRLGIPLCFTEIHYNPTGGSAYEFLELQNTGAVPLDLSGTSLRGVDFRFKEGTFLAAGERIVLISSVDPKAFAQHYPGVRVGGLYEGSLSNAGERLELIDRAGSLISSVTYDRNKGWPKVADGGGYSLEIIDPDGDPNDPANWRASVNPGGSPGDVNPVVALGEVRLSEVFAERDAPDAATNVQAGFVELRNLGNVAVELTGWSLKAVTRQAEFAFPAGSRVDPNSYLVLWCDAATNAAGFHTGFDLPPKGETLLFVDPQNTRRDAVTFGLQVASCSVARLGADATWQFAQPTPGSANQPAALGAVTGLFINEFMANPTPGTPDWIELNNSNPVPVSLQGVYVGTSNALFRIQSLSAIAPGGFVQLFADEEPGADHLDFKLAATGGMITLSDTTGLELRRVTYSPQAEGVSRGLLPDGSAESVSFPGSASPGRANYVRPEGGPMLNEAMICPAQAELGTTSDTSWIELFNVNTFSLDLSGMSLSASPTAAGQWIFPVGTRIPPQGYRVIGCDPSQPASTQDEVHLNSSLLLPGSSGSVYLWNRKGQVLDSVEYGFQLPGRSIGRTGPGWTLLAFATPGAPNAVSASLGSVANLRLNEWMANSATGADWFEIYNLDPLPVSLAGLYLSDDPSLSGQSNTLVGALSFVAPHGWVTWTADGRRDRGHNHAGFKLDTQGETLRLLTSALGIIDTIDYAALAPGVSQGRFPDGAPNQVDFQSPTPGTQNTLPANLDSDLDGLPDPFELTSGFNPRDPGDALLDADADGLNNLQEFLAGTDPHDPGSRLQLEVALDSAGWVNLSFHAVPNKTYSILYTENPSGGSWTKLADLEAPSTAAILAQQDRQLPTSGARFYRLQTPKLP